MALLPSSELKSYHDNKNINSNFSKYAWKIEKPKGPFQNTNTNTVHTVFPGARPQYHGEGGCRQELSYSQAEGCIVQDVQFFLPMFSRTTSPEDPTQCLANQTRSKGH